jgi:hypothetical protein
MARIFIGDHQMELHFSYGVNGVLIVEQSETKTTAKGGPQTQAHAGKFFGVDPVLLEAALLELGYIKEPKS